MIFIDNRIHLAKIVCIRSKAFYIAFLFVVFLFYPLSSLAQDNYEIRKIIFKGNKTFSKSDLLDHIVMHESGFYSRRIQKQEPSLYNSEFMESDIERLLRFYQSQGFLNAAVELDSLSKNDKKHRLDLYISIKETDPIKVNRVIIRVNDSLLSFRTDSLLRRVYKNLTLKKGNNFVDDNLYNDISTINKFFINLGYAYVKTDFELNLNSDTDSVDILYKTDKGNICQIGETTITGNKYIKETTIRKQFEYKTGDIYCPDLLNKTRKQLYGLQLFKIASVTAQTDKKNQTNPIPIQIRIEEMPRWMTKFGVGYGTEDKFRAFIDITYRGLFGRTSRLNLYAKHSALTPYYISLAWIEPQFFLNKLSISVNPYIRRDNEPGYNTQTIGLSFPAGYTINEKIRTSLTYYIERVTQQIESNDADVPDPESEDYLYNKSGLSGWFVFNNALPVFSPEKGGIVSIGAKLNGYIFGSDFDYTKVWIDVRKYQKLGRFVLSLRGMIGGIYSSDSTGFIPVEDRFYSGGSNSNRGWERAMIGPKRESGTPLGGKSIVEMNIELRYRLVWRIDVAAFMDISNIWTKAYHYDFNDLNYAAGGGLRVNTPIGPVRFDIGVPIWNEKKSVQFFFSVGQAF